MSPRLRACVLRGCQISFMTGIAGALLGFTAVNEVIGAIKWPILVLGLSFAYALFTLGKLLDVVLSPWSAAPRKRKPTAPQPMVERVVFPGLFWAALAAYFGWFLFDWSLSPYPHHGRAVLAHWISYLGCFFGVGLFFPDEKERNRVLKLYLAVAVLQAVYTFFQFAELDFIDRPRFEFGFPFRRVAGTLGNPGYLGGYLAGCMALGAGFLFAMPARKARNARLVWLAGLAVFVSLVLTFSRSALLAVAFTVLLLVGYGLLHRRRHPGLFRRVLPFSPVVRRLIVAAGFVVVAWFAVEQKDLARLIVQRLSGAGQIGALDARKIMYQANLKMIADHPVKGVGPGNYVSFFGNYRSVAFTEYHNPSREVNEYAHSEFMQQAVELGLPGLLFYLLWLSAILQPAMARLWRDPPSRAGFLLFGATAAVLSGLVANLADVLLQRVSYSSFTWTLLGWIAATLWSRPVPESPRARGLLWTLALPLAFFSTNLAVRDYVCDLLLFRSRNLVFVAEGQTSDPRAAARLAELAVKASPDSRPARYFLGTLYYSLRRYADARDVYTQLLATEGRFADVVYNLGTFHFFLGEYADAERLYRQAIADFPGKADYHFQLGSTLWELRRVEDATPCFLRAAQLYEEQRSAPGGLAADDFEHLATCYLRADRSEQAIQVYQEKLAQDGGMADTYYMLGAVYMARTEFAPAAENFEKAAAGLRIQHSNRITLYQTLHYLGQCYLELDRLPEARETLAQALRLAPAGYPQRADLQALLAQAQADSPLAR